MGVRVVVDVDVVVGTVTSNVSSSEGRFFFLEPRFVFIVRFNVSSDYVRGEIYCIIMLTYPCQENQEWLLQQRLPTTSTQRW